MDKQLVIFYLKRHLLGIVGLLLAAGFVGGGFVLDGKMTASVEAADAEYKSAVDNRDKIQNSSLKVDSKNVAVLRDVTTGIHRFCGQCRPSVWQQAAHAVEQ